MRAWLLQDSPGKFEIGDVPTPFPGPGEVQVRVFTAGLNHLDLWVAQGKPRAPKYPHVGGADGAGVVAAVGEGVIDVRIGDDVIINPALWCGKCEHCLSGDTVLCFDFGIIGEHCWGTFADYVVVPEHNVVPKPQGRSWEDCGAFGLTYMTAFHMLERAKVTSADRVLITGIGGGVAAAALVLAVERGADVTVSSRSKEKVDMAVPFGASGVVWPASNIPENEFDVVIDSVGAALWPTSIHALKLGGRFITCGATAGAKVELSLPDLFWSHYEIIGSTMGSTRDFEAVTKLVSDGIPIIRDEIIWFDNWSAGFERLAGGEQFGKILMTHMS